MNLVTVSIDEFPQDNAPWRIDGLGKLHGTGSSRSEPLIDVFLSQLVPDYKDPLSKSSLAGPSRRVPIKVGLIALLKPGSVWINKVRCVTAHQRPRQLETSITPNQVELRTWRSEFEFEGRTVPVIPTNQFYLPRESWLGLSDSWVVLIRRPRSDIPYLLIPSSVIFQKCFGSSPEGVRRLLRGELHRVIDRPRPLETGDGIKTYFVEVFKEIPSAHAWAYANLYIDTNGQREHARLMRSLVAASINAERSSPRGLQTYINLGFPFSNLMHLRVQGKAMAFLKHPNETKPEFAFMATEIIDLDVGLVFNRLVIHRKNNADQGENADDPTLENAWGTPPPSSVDLHADQHVPAVSDAEPLSGLEKLCAEASSGFNALDLEVIKDPKVTQKYRRQVVEAGTKSSFDGTTTTGDSKSGHQGPAELDLESHDTPPTPVTLEGFVETLRILRRAGITFKTVAVTDTSRQIDRDDVVNFLPRHIKGSRSWHLVSDGPHAAPRGYIVAIHKSGGVWHHFIELERKEEKGRSLAHIRTAQGSQIDARQMRLFMIDVVRERGWNASLLRPHWNLTTINHSPKQGLQHFANAIAKAVGVTLEKT